MKSLYQFRLLDELKASDTQVRISQLIGRRNEDGSLRDVEFQKETVVLQNGDGSVFEMAFASASGGMLTFHKRGLNENNPPVEIEHNKKTWGNGTKCYVTAGAGDFIDKDEPGVWNGKQTFEGGIIVKGDTAFDGQIDAKRGVKNPTFATKEEASSFFSDSEKVEGLLVNIKGNTYRRNSITKSWEMLGLADINQEKVQENSTKISTLEEKMTTAEGQISQLVEASGADHLEEHIIVGEKYTIGDTLVIQKAPDFKDCTKEQAVGNMNNYKEIHIQGISSGKPSNTIELAVKKVGTPLNLVIEIRKGIKVDVSEDEAYWYGGEVVASATIPASTITNESKKISVEFDYTFGTAENELLSVVVYQQGGTINPNNYYILMCDNTQYSECFRYIAVQEGGGKYVQRQIAFFASEAFKKEFLVKKNIRQVFNYSGNQNKLIDKSDAWVDVDDKGSIFGAIVVNHTKEINRLFSPKAILNLSMEYDVDIRGKRSNQAVFLEFKSKLLNINTQRHTYRDEFNNAQSIHSFSMSRYWADNDQKIIEKGIIKKQLQYNNFINGRFGFAVIRNNVGSSTNLQYQLQHELIFLGSQFNNHQGKNFFPREIKGIGEKVACTTFGRHIDGGWVAG